MRLGFGERDLEAIAGLARCKSCYLVWNKKWIYLGVIKGASSISAVPLRSVHDYAFINAEQKY